MRRSAPSWLRPQPGRLPIGILALAVVAGGTFALAPRAAASQSIGGRLLDTETGLPVPYGLVMLFTEAGDSITSTISDASGEFRLSSTSPGSFVLRAVALGYRETSAGVFELGRDGSLTIEYGLPPQPLPIDEIVVSLERPALMHHLVRNGFVRRFQRGLGIFITPHDIGESPATSTEQLLEGLAGVRIGTVYSRPASDVLLPRPDIGETIQILGVGGRWCAPTIYLDGIRFYYDPPMGFTLSNVAQLGTVEAIEVYRRPAEIPVEYTTDGTSDCGVLVVWTTTGAAVGSGAGEVVATGAEGLPAVGREGAPPESGEAIRMELDPAAARPRGLGRTWQGTFLMLRGDDLVARDTLSGRAVAVPLGAVRALQVSRERPARHAVIRGATLGSAVGLAVWGGLSFLCSWSACNGAAETPLLPAGVAGLLVGVLSYSRGPGSEWVRSDPGELARGPGGPELVVRLRLGAR